jgi:hypothetical protein
MRKLLLLIGLVVALIAIPMTLAASPTVRLSLIHALRGCHEWGSSDGRSLGASHVVLLKPGGKLEIRVSCPMAFNVKQLAGPKIALGAAPWQTGTTHTLVFKKAGVYQLMAMNVQSSEEMGLQTLGEDNMPVLIVRVR